MSDKLTHKEFEKFLLTLPKVWLDYPFGEDTAVYKYSESAEDRTNGKIMAIVTENSKPLKISLKCDPKLAELLREKYETVIPGYHLNKKHWNTIICTGQIPTEEIIDLTRLSYQLVGGKLY